MTREEMQAKADAFKAIAANPDLIPSYRRECERQAERWENEVWKLDRNPWRQS